MFTCSGISFFAVLCVLYFDQNLLAFVIGASLLIHGVQGFYGYGKSGGKCSFLLGQGKSGNVRESLGNLQWSREKLHFHSIGQKKYFSFHEH